MLRGGGAQVGFGSSTNTHRAIQNRELVNRFEILPSPALKTAPPSRLKLEEPFCEIPPSISLSLPLPLIIRVAKISTPWRISLAAFIATHFLIVMRGRLSMISRFSDISLPILILLSCFPGFISPAVVMLKSIEIYRTHDWFKQKPTVYFKCNGENKTTLPDVRGTKILHSFNGEESWQPLTELPSKKCKRCGFYEKDFLTGDDVFDEWELCPSDFSAPDGNYTRIKEEEFNATFLCKECMALAAGSPPSARSSSDDDKGGGRINYVVIVLISLAVAFVAAAVFIAGYKYWQKRKRQREQARFLKLFEEGDDIEDELGLGEGMI